MSISRPKRWITLGSVLLLVGAVAFFGPDLLARIIRERSMTIIEQAAGPRSHIGIGSVQLDLFAGDLTWKDLRIEQPIDSADTSWTRGRSLLIAGNIGRVTVKGLSIWRLLAWRTVQMHSLAVVSPRLQLLFSHHAGHGGEPGANTKNLINTIVLDSLSVDSGSLVWRNVRDQRPGAIAKHFTAWATGIHAVLPHRRVPFTFTFATTDLVLDSTVLALPPLYDLHVAQLRLAHPDSVLQAKGITLTARAGPQDYGRVIKYETDLVTFRSDSIGLRGLDLQALLNQRSLRAGEARISGTDLNDSRDKTMPNAPFRNKPMPARLLRQLPFTLCLDSLVVDGLNVEYNEKDTVTTGFGKVDFTGIQAVAHGICTLHPEERPEMHLIATAWVYQKAPIHFDFRTALFDSSDRFSVKARIGPLPFTVFNAMTNDLLLVRAVDGTIGGIDYTFDADHGKGQGRVDMEYAGLKVRIARRDGSGNENVLKSFLVNQAIRTKNTRDGPNFRHGDFTVDRVRDKQVFNYLWRGLREGMMETVLPRTLKDARNAVSALKDAGRSNGREADGPRR
jgi:hypothetical protein